MPKSKTPETHHVALEALPGLQRNVHIAREPRSEIENSAAIATKTSESPHFISPKTPAIISTRYKGGLGKASGNTTPITTPITTPNRILALIQSDARISQQELAAKLGITRDGVKYHLKKLREKGNLSHTGPTRCGVWEVIRENQR